MQNRKRINEEIELVSSLKTMAESYQEISVHRMQKIRRRVLSAREFLDKLIDIYKEVKVSYKQEVNRIENRRKGDIESLSFKTGNKNGKIAYVFLSSNSKLYGDIIRRVCDLFVESTNITDGDRIVIGKVGKELLEEKGIHNYLYFELSDNTNSPSQLNKVVEGILAYEDVTVFYGKCANIMVQSPISVNVNESIDFSSLWNVEAETTEVKGVPIDMVQDFSMNVGYLEVDAKPKFYFEPSLHQVVNLFDNQIVTSFFTQTIHESDLARHASRVREMESALQNIHKTSGGLKKLKVKFKHSEDNSKQMQRLSGMRLWNR